MTSGPDDSRHGLRSRLEGLGWDEDGVHARAMCWPSSGLSTNIRIHQGSFARLEIPQFLPIPLCPCEEIDKIRRILSR